MSTQDRQDWSSTSYEDRLEVLVEATARRFPDDADIAGANLAEVAMLLRAGRDVDACNAAVITNLEHPGTGPFWMMPLVMLTYGARQHLAPDTLDRIARSWETVRQQRGDTENHWVLYHASLYLAAQEYDDDRMSWNNGLTSAENMAEAKEWLGVWIHGATRLGQSEYNPTHYVAEYAVPLLMLVAWAREPEVADAARMMLDFLFAELATVSLHGVLRGPNSRTDDVSVVERWSAMASLYSWLLFGTTHPPSSLDDWWGTALAQLAHTYRPPEVIRRIAVSPPAERLQRDRARSRRMLRGSDVEFRSVCKTQYLRPEYAVGSTQGGLSDAIQGHAWDVTWHETDPRGMHPTLFSTHPHHSGAVLQKFFSSPPEPMALSIPFEGKPSYLEPDKLIGVSPYEEVSQDLDTVVALYAIPEDSPHPHVNTFLSKDLRDVTTTPTGWLVGRGGDAFVALRVLTPYDVAPHRTWPTPWDPASARETESRLLVTRHRRTGTVVQVARASDHESLEAFADAVDACAFEHGVEPRPWVRMTTLRNRRIEAEHGRATLIEGAADDPSSWQLFEGTHMTSTLGSGRVSIRHGDLERVLDFASLTTQDHDHGQAAPRVPQPAPTEPARDRGPRRG
ncbi:hypothetical protein [Pseudactinotalea suaedae]|uniref:hypothetical protein n=1 Tax=Pseudactinotalea suaedae TaxID=1524924 RepID=UPI0012E24459|nr:hypothetical protein [Pseudactinotalea suaedae]